MLSPTMHHLPLGLYYTPEQLKSFYNSEHLKALYGSEQLKSLYGSEQLKSLYNHEQLKAFYNHEQLKNMCNAEQLKTLGSPEALKSSPPAPTLLGNSPSPSSSSSVASSLFSIDNILSQSRPLLAHRPTPTYPFPYPPVHHLHPEMLGKHITISIIHFTSRYNIFFFLI